MLSLFSVSNRMKFSFWGFPTPSVLTLIQMRLKVFLNCFSFHLIGWYYIFLLFSISRCVLALISSHFKVFFPSNFTQPNYSTRSLFFFIVCLLYYTTMEFGIIPRFTSSMGIFMILLSNCSWEYRQKNSSSFLIFLKICFCFVVSVNW